MKKSNILLICFSLLVVFCGCNSNDEIETTVEECQSSEGTVNIMPLGASRVQGLRPVYESYRYELWKDLIDGGWSINYVGNEKDFTQYDSYQNFCFDSDHEGQGGWTSTQINNEIERWLNETEMSDIVLFSSPGGNDALQGKPLESILPNINAIINKIQSHNPNITILLEQMAPGKSSFMNEELTASFDQIHDIIVQIATAQTTATSRVIPVDMATGFSDDFLADYVHYNTDGAKFIAERYYEKLIPYLEK